MRLREALLDWSTRFTQLSMNDLTRYAHTAGLSMAQMSVLLHLHYQGACEVTHFSEMLKISRAGASQMIERLVQQGVVQRFASPEDRRVRLVDLTESGKKIVAESIEARIQWVDELVDMITEQESDQITQCLNQLNEYTQKIDLKMKF